MQNGKYFLFSVQFLSSLFYRLVVVEICELSSISSTSCPMVQPSNMLMTENLKNSINNVSSRSVHTTTSDGFLNARLLSANEKHQNLGKFSKISIKCVYVP